MCSPYFLMVIFMVQTWQGAPAFVASASDGSGSPCAGSGASAGGSADSSAIGRRPSPRGWGGKFLQLSQEWREISVFVLEDLEDFGEFSRFLKHKNHDWIILNNWWLTAAMDKKPAGSVWDTCSKIMFLLGIPIQSNWSCFDIDMPLVSPSLPEFCTMFGGSRVCFSVFRWIKYT